MSGHLVHGDLVKLARFVDGLRGLTVETGVVVAVDGPTVLELQAGENDGVRPGGGSRVDLCWDGSEYSVEPT